jgi:hypothetical protein
MNEVIPLNKHEADEIILAIQESLRVMPDGGEKHIEEKLATKLEAKGKNPRRQVATEAGVIDIATDDTIYEVKAVLSRDSVFKAVGQLLLYKESHNRSVKNMVITGVPGDGMKLKPFVNQLGIELEPLPEFKFDENMEAARQILEHAIQIIKNVDFLFKRDAETDTVESSLFIIEMALKILRTIGSQLEINHQNKEGV